MASIEENSIKYILGAAGLVSALFGSIFGSHKYMQSQLDKHKANTDKAIDDHKDEVKYSLEKLQGDYKDDMKHLADHAKRTTKLVEDNTKAIFDELKTLNQRVFDIVKEGSKH
jgi:gas vesicle protein